MYLSATNESEKFLFYQEKWHRIRENHLGERIFQELIRRIDNLEKMEANAVWHSKRFRVRTEDNSLRMYCAVWKRRENPWENWILKFLIKNFNWSLFLKRYCFVDEIYFLKEESILFIARKTKKIAFRNIEILSDFYILHFLRN